MEKVEICELIERKLGLNHLVTIRFGIANCFLSVIGLKFGLVRRQLCTRLQLYRVQCMQHVAVVLELHRPGAAPAEAWIFLIFFAVNSRSDCIESAVSTRSQRF